MIAFGYEKKSFKLFMGLLVTFWTKWSMPVENKNARQRLSALKKVTSRRRGGFFCINLFVTVLGSPSPFLFAFTHCVVPQHQARKLLTVWLSRLGFSYD